MISHQAVENIYNILYRDIQPTIVVLGQFLQIKTIQNNIYISYYNFQRQWPYNYKPMTIDHNTTYRVDDLHNHKLLKKKIAKQYRNY